MRLRVVAKSGEGERCFVTPRVSVTNAETGEELRVRSILVSMEAGKVPILEISTFDFEVDVEGEAVVKRINPHVSPEIQDDMTEFEIVRP